MLQKLTRAMGWAGGDLERLLSQGVLAPSGRQGEAEGDVVSLPPKVLTPLHFLSLSPLRSYF